MVYILTFADGYVTDDLSTPGVASGMYCKQYQTVCK